MSKLLLIATLITAVAPTVARAQATDHHAQLDARGAKGMGFDQNATTHHFYLYEDGGAIEITVKDPKDSANLSAIRMHLPHVAKMFAAGDFSTPHFVHDAEVPGTDGMARLRDRISYAYEDIPGGGRLRIATRQPPARTAIHDFLRYQITDHRTGDPVSVTEERKPGEGRADRR